MVITQRIRIFAQKRKNSAKKTPVIGAKIALWKNSFQKVLAARREIYTVCGEIETAICGGFVTLTNIMKPYAQTFVWNGMKKRKFPKASAR
jgi:hypothetical protein